MFIHYLMIICKICDVFCEILQFRDFFYPPQAHQASEYLRALFLAAQYKNPNLQALYLI